MYSFNKIIIIFNVIANLRKEKNWSYEQFVEFVRKYSPMGFALSDEDISDILSELKNCQLIDLVYKGKEIVGVSM